jgi:hypothetical protein
MDECCLLVIAQRRADGLLGRVCEVAEQVDGVADIKVVVGREEGLVSGLPSCPLGVSQSLQYVFDVLSCPGPLHRHAGGIRLVVRALCGGVEAECERGEQQRFDELCPGVAEGVDDLEQAACGECEGEDRSRAGGIDAARAARLASGGSWAPLGGVWVLEHGDLVGSVAAWACLWRRVLLRMPVRGAWRVVAAVARGHGCSRATSDQQRPGRLHGWFG